VSPLVFAQNLVRCIGPRNLSGLLQRYPVCASIGLRITFLAIVTEHLILGPATLLSLMQVTDSYDELRRQLLINWKVKKDK
jgi:hypothetical protein